MKTSTQKLRLSIIKQPAAWLPIAISLAMLTFILSYIAIFGIVYHEDEGTPAHLFQLWLVLEVLMVAFFAIKRLLREPRQALIILVIQIVAVLVACAPIFYFNL